MSQFIEMFKEKGYPLRMLKSFADVSTGGTPSKANLEYWNGDKPWVSAEDMKNKYVYDTCEKVTEAGYATCKIIPVDTLMYVCRGSIGVMAINKIECATNQSICRAKCHDNVCNVEFLYHALMYQKDNIKKMGTGTSFKSLNQTSFSELKIELPPYNEQMKFVSIAQQADKSEFVGCKSQFIEMFGTVENNTHNFPIMTIGEFANCFAGATPSTSHPEYWENGRIRWMSSGEVHKGHVEDTDSRITELGYKSASTRMVPIHSIVIAIAGQGKTRGTVAITEVDLCTNQSLCAIVPDERVNYSYLYHNLQGRYLELRGLSGDVNGRGGLNLKIIQKIPVILPPIEKQQQFASIAQQADKSEYYN